MTDKDWVYCNKDPKPEPVKFPCTKCGGQIVGVDRVYRFLEIESTDGPNLGEVLSEIQDDSYGLAFECHRCGKSYEIEELEKMEEKVEEGNAPQKTT